MQTYFVRVECDVTAKVHAQPLRYRAYVNDELFAERTWIWTDSYLKENFQIQAAPGVYPIRFETVDTNHGCITVQNYKTDVDIIKSQIQQLQKQLKRLKKRNIDKNNIKSVEQQIQELNDTLQMYLKIRSVKIIDYQGQTAVEISNESQ
jgi:hypothetical protein